MAKVVDRITVQSFNVEIYDDGDCVFTLPAGGYLQISSEVLNRISQKSKAQVRGRNGASSSDMTDPLDAQAAHSVSESNRDATSDEVDLGNKSKYSRRISQLVPHASVMATPTEGSSTPDSADSESAANLEAAMDVSATPTPGEVAEAITAAVPAHVESGWEVVYLDGTEVVAKHVYISRGKAREGQIDTPVGEGGRLQ